jgi:hypothetical protein
MIVGCCIYFFKQKFEKTKKREFLVSFVNSDRGWVYFVKKNNIGNIGWEQRLSIPYVSHMPYVQRWVE